MSRLVNFRLSDEDILALDAAVKTAGAKDRSDWLRVKIRSAGSLQNQVPVKTMVEDLFDKIAEASPLVPSVPAVEKTPETDAQHAHDWENKGWGTVCKICRLRR